MATKNDALAPESDEKQQTKYQGYCCLDIHFGLAFRVRILITLWDALQCCYDDNHGH